MKTYRSLTQEEIQQLKERDHALRLIGMKLK